MRISDWSSDVCSSDLRPVQHDAAALEQRGEGDIVDVAIDVQVLEPRLEVSAHRVIAGVEPPAFRFGHDQRAPIWPSLRRACQSAMAPRTLSTCRRAPASASAASFFMKIGRPSCRERESPYV